MSRSPSQFDLETLEPRLLLSGDPVFALADLDGQGLSDGSEAITVFAELEANIESDESGQDSLFEVESQALPESSDPDGSDDASALNPSYVNLEQPLPENDLSLSQTVSSQTNVGVEQLVTTLNAGQAPPADGSFIELASPGNILRPMLIVPGIAGTFAAPGAEEAWYTQRGIAPEFLKVDPLAGYYNDIAKTLEDAAGYVLGDNLWEAAYDWRMAPGPLDGVLDGHVDGLTAESLTDDVYEFGVDYLGYWMDKALDRWVELYGGERPDSVDIITHSTGGLVARTYIQSDAYPTDGNPTGLPSVENLFLVAVPNRGAPKAWNPLHDNFSSDVAYKIVLSKVMNNAYEMYLNGETIYGADGDIVRPEVGDPLSQEDFVVAYVPTVQGLLATYEFLYDGASDLTPEDANNGPFTNAWILDLNAGLDELFSLSAFENGTTSAGEDPNAFADLVTGMTYVYYSDGTLNPSPGYAGEIPDAWETVTDVRKFTGPQGGGDNVTNFDEFYGHLPALDEVWYRDDTTSGAGDGTVPTDSSLGQFDVDPNKATRFDILKVDDPLLNEDNTINKDSISHTGIMSNLQMQTAILDALAIPYNASEISTDQANSHEELLAAVLSLQILDPAELLVNVNWGDFAGFAVNTSIREGLAYSASKFGELNTILVDALEDADVITPTVNPLNTPLPFTNNRVGDLIDFETLFNEYVSQPILEYMVQNPDGSTDELAAFINGQLGSNINLTPDKTFIIKDNKALAGLVSLSNTSLQTAIGVGPEAVDAINEIIISIPFEYGQVSDVPLDLGFYAGLQGFEIDATATIAYEAKLAATLVIGFDMRPGLSTNERFFFRINEVEMSAEANTSDLNAALNVGILGTTINNGSVAAAAGISFGFNDTIKDDRGNITKAKILSNGSDFMGAIQLQRAANPFASIDATLPISVSWPGLSGVVSPTLTFSDDNIFDGLTDITPTGFGDLIDFTSLSTGSIEDAFETFVSTLERIANSPVLQATIPFVAGAPLTSIVNLANILDSNLVDQLRNEDGALIFSNLQEFVSLVNGSMAAVNALDTNPIATFDIGPLSNHDAGGIYDSASKTLTFNIGYDFGFLLEEQAIDFEYELNPLEIFIGGGDLTVSGNGNFSFDMSLGMDTPVASIKGDLPLPADGILAEPALLQILVSGGVLSNGQFIDIEVAPDATNGDAADLIADINTAIASSLVAGLVQARLDNGALVLETTFAGPFPSLAVNAVAGLGIGSDAFDTYQPSAFAEVSNLSATFNAGLAANNFTAGGRVGYVGIFVNEGSANLNLDFDIDFLPGGPKTIKTLFLEVAADPTSLLPNVSLAGTGAILLEGITVDGGFVADPGPATAIEINLAAGVSYPVDPLDGTQFEVNFIGDFSEMLKFRSLDFATMVQVLRDGLGIIQDLTQGDFLNQPIPFIGGSINDVLKFAEDFALFIDQLEQNAPATIQAFTEQLTFALQDLLDAAFPSNNLQPQVQVVFGPDDVLKVDFAFLAHASLDLNFELDPGVNIPGLGKIIDLKGESQIQATLNAWLRLVFGIDLTNPLAPSAHLFDGTEAVVEILLSAENINFSAAAPLGFFIRGGSARIDDGTEQRGPATASFVFAPNGTDRLAVGSVAFTDFSFSVVGVAQADLPVRFPIDTPENELEDPIAFLVNFQDLGNPTFTGPDFEELFANLNLFDSLSDGLDLLFFAFEELVDGEILGFEIPFIGDQLADAASFILELREEVRAVINSATTYSEVQLEGLLYNALGPSGLDFLLPIGGSGLPTGLEIVSQSDVNVEITGEGVNASNIEIEMRLGQLIELLDIGITFADGLPGLNLDFDTNLLIEMAWEWKLVFGVNRSSGFYMETRPGDEFQIRLDAGFPDTSLSGSFGFLGMSAQTRDGGLGAGLDLTAGVDILPGQTGIITLGDISSNGFSSFDVSLSGQAVLDLEMTLGFADLSGEPVNALPSFLADFFFRWEFINASVQDGLATGTPEVRFGNIRLDVGTFFSDFLRPIIETVAAYLEPLRPLVDFLSQDLKFISWKPIEKIFDQNDDGKVTVLDLVDLFGGNLSPTAYDFLDAVVMVFDILDAFEKGQTPGRDGGLTISLGSFDFTNIDFRTVDVDSADFLGSANFTNPIDSINAQFAGLGGSAASIFAQTQEEDSSGSGKFEFLLFEPENLIRLIMGQTVDFFTYTLPEITVDFTYSNSYVVFSPPVVKVRFGFTIGFSANLTFGYDSSGIAAYLQEDGEIGDLFGGFYVGVGDSYPPQLKLFGSIYGGASVGIGIAEVAVDLGAALIANFSLIDPGEGKLYFWQIANLVENRGLFEAVKCLFIVDGEVYGFANLSVEVAFVTVFSIEIGRVTIWSASTDGDADCFNFLIPDRLEQFEDGRPNNDVRTFAADLGIAPGVNLRGASISTPGDADYYRFELIKPEILEILLDGHADFALTLYDASGLVVATKPPGNDRKRMITGTLPAGEYYIGIEAPDSDAYAAYDLDISPGAGSSTRVFYVNTPTAAPPEVHSFYSLAPGDDSFADAGADPLRPASSLDRIISLHSPTVNDLILFDTGLYEDSLSISGGPTGMTLAGAPADRFLELPETVVFGSVLQGTGSNPAATVISTQDLTMARFRFANSERGLVVAQSDGLHGVGLSFENNGIGLDMQGSDNALFEQTHVTNSSRINTGLEVTSSSGFTLLDTNLHLASTGLVLNNSTGALVQGLEAGEVDDVIIANGGSGLSLQSIVLEGAKITQTDMGQVIYTGDGQTAIRVDNHSGLVLDDVDIRRYGTGLHLTNIATAGISSLQTVETDTGLRGWGLDDTTITGSHLVGSEGSYAILIGLTGDPASPGSNFSIAQSTLGILPPGDGVIDPLSVNVRVADVTGFSTSFVDLHGNFEGVNLTGATWADGNVVNGSLHFTDSSDVNISGNIIESTGAGDTSRIRFENVSGGQINLNILTKMAPASGDDVTGTLTGIGVDLLSSDGIEVNNNDISRIDTGISIGGVDGNLSTTSTIHHNDLSIGATGILVTDNFVSDLAIHNNSVTSYNMVGIHAIGYAEVTANGVYQSSVGIRFEQDTPGLFSNTVQNNAIGITGGGYLGNDDRMADKHNLVTQNIIGIIAEGDQDVGFNKVYENDIGLQILGDNVSAHHNIIYQNIDKDVEVSGSDGSSLWNNTIYSTSTYAIHVTGNASGTDLRNNIVWSVGGTVLGVDFPSGDDFSSDYNNYYASGGAVLFEWIKTFDDLLDWQIELGLDLNSLGTTRIDPALDQPTFVNLANSDFRVVDLTSTTINSGDPSFTFDNEPGPNAGPNGLRINQGAFGDTELAALSADAYVRVLSPNYYLDYSPEKARRIIWEFFNVAGNVSLELFEDGTGKVADMTIVTVDNIPDQIFDQPVSHGSYFWSPQMSGIVGDNTKRYHIRVTAAENNSLQDDNREAFSIPVTSNDFFVNDGSTAGDQLTSAAGDNRFTGKLAETPKAILPAILQNYSLAANQTVFIDTGYYLHLRNLLISSADEFGNNEAFTLTGPDGDGTDVSLDRADLREGSVALLFDDASFVTVRNLSLEGGYKGIEARNNSTFLTLENLNISNHAGIQVHLFDGSDRAIIDGVHLSDGGGDGLVVDALLQAFRNSTVDNHDGLGVSLIDSGNTLVEANIISNNRDGGLYVHNRVADTETIVGSDDLSLSLGNVFHDNLGRQVDVREKVLVAGNSVYHTVGSPDEGTGIGIYLTNSTARSNVVSGHASGIYLSGGTVEQNRIYNNSVRGIALIGFQVETVSRNVIYSNPIGIEELRSQNTGGDIIRNNLIYDFLTAAYTTIRTNGFIFESNTVYSTTGDGVIIRLSTGGTIVNNIFHLEAGAAINLDVPSQVNLASDYNLFDLSGSASVGIWAGGERVSLLNWRNASFIDDDSLSTNPMFVDPDGIDGVLGFASMAQDGRDDNFHLQSIAGSIRNGSLAPVRDAGSDQAVWLVSSRVADAMQSPAIDRGDDAYAFDLEPSPNGNFINMGAFGNTELASQSPVTYVLVTRPGGGETWPIEQSFNIQWRSHDFIGTVDIFLLEEGVVDPVATVTTATENDGLYEWSLTNALTPGSNYRITVVRGDDPTVSGASLDTFSISEPISFYYVNDANVIADGYTTAPGDNANDGLSSATPKASIRAILEAYDLGEGDVILVDAGTYNITTNIIVDADDSFVTIRGFKDVARPELETLIDRGNLLAGAYGFELNGVSNLTLEWLTLSGSDHGVHGGDGLAHSLTVRESRFINNERAGIFIEKNNPDLFVEGSYFEGTGSSTTGQAGQDSGINYAGISSIIRGNTFLNNYSEGIYWTTAYTTEIQSHLIEGNTASGSRYGIRTSNRTNDALVTGNTVYSNVAEGIYLAGSRSVATQNSAYQNGSGIRLFNSSTAINNTDIHDNGTGIYLGTGSAAIANTVFNNTNGVWGNNARLMQDNVAYGNDRGIVFNYNTIVRGNTAYANRGGYHADGFIGSNSQWRASMYNNLSYGNTEYAAKFERTVGLTKVYNNTFVQAGEGTTTVIFDNAPNLDFWNNIVVSDAGQAMNISLNSQPGFTSDFNLFSVTNGAATFLWGELALDTQIDWFYNVSADGHSIFADPVFVDPVSGDYHLSPGSPAVDAGDPDSNYLNEPEPAGSRINLGAYGNTEEAAISDLQSIQVINPTTLDKLLQNSQASLDFIASGFLDSQNVAFFNTGLGTIGRWVELADATGIVRESISTSTAIDTSNVTEPGPVELYRENWRTNFGIGSSMDLDFALQPGDYLLRLHFVDTSTSANEIFDLEVNGALVLDDYAINVVAGGRYIAVVEEVPVTVGEDGKVTITITSGQGYGRIAGIEVRRLSETGTPDPTFTVEVSYDSGQNYATLATGINVDSRGYGSLEWSPFQSTDGATVQLRVTSETTEPVSGISNPFLVGNDGANYYVNDASQAEDVYTTAIGNNANSGKSPSSPMASLEALLTVYSPGAGDTIFVDSGTYNLTRNIILQEGESGILLKGAYDPDNAAAVTVFDRGNVATTAYGIEIAGAENLVIEHLTITNAYRGIFADNGNANDLTIRNSRFLENKNAGIHINRDSFNLLVEDNYFEGDGTFNVQPQDNGLFYGGTHAIVRNNVFVNNYRTGMDISSPSPNVEMNYLIEGNTVSGGLYGIRADGWVNDALVRNNTVSNSSTTGISLSGGRSVLTQNIAFENGTGLQVQSGALVTNNIDVYGNTIGINVGSNSKAIGNIVHDNTEGIRSSASGSGAYNRIVDNVSYNNTTGFRFNIRTILNGNIAYGNEGGFFADGFLGSNSQWRGYMHNNLAYGNSEYALRILRAVGAPKVYNNTFVQSGEGKSAVILDNAPNVLFWNNIVSVDTAAALNITANSQAGFNADYNVFDLVNVADAFLWGDHVFSDQIDWFYNTANDRHSTFADPMFVDPVNGDHHLQPGSPAVDAGDPDWGYGVEPTPEGGRLNSGFYGNTSEATTSPEQAITVLDPTFLDKPLQVGQTPIRFHTSGFLEQQSVTWFNAGVSFIDGWIPLNQTGGLERDREIAIDFSGVADPAPEEAYQEYLVSAFGIGARIDLVMELNPGEYVLRFHFAQVDGSAAKPFNIEIDGSVVVENFNIVDAAGGSEKAVVEEVSITVGESGEVLVSFVSNERYAYISAIEAVRVNSSGSPDPRFNVQTSFDQGQNFGTIASGIGVDLRGIGTAIWIPDASTNGAANAVIKVSSIEPQPISGISAPFLVANDGNRYYVNDSSTENDVFTSAVGNNLNSGKSPSSPMASLEALFAVFDPKAGDTIYVDSGTYLMSRNVVLTVENSGITIIGASDPENVNAVTILDRDNLGSPAYIFEISGANNVTLDSLTLTNGYRGVMVFESQGSNLTIRNSRIIFNQDAGVYVDRYNPGLLVEDSYFEGLISANTPGNQQIGLEVYATDISIRQSTFMNNYRNALVIGDSREANPQALIEDSHFEGGSTSNGLVQITEDNSTILRSTFANSRYDGLYLQGINSIVRDSVAYGNGDEGFNIRNNARAENNIAYDNSRGFFGSTNSELINNVSFANERGMFVFNALAENNRVYGNTLYGIGGQIDSQIIGNQVYNNEIGIQAFRYSSQSFRGRISDNVVYDNGTTGIQVDYGNGFMEILNNTVYQPAGNALLIRNVTSAYILNNILWVDAGFAINAESASLGENVQMDYNLFNLSADPNARIGELDEVFADSLADWQGLSGMDANSLIGDPIFFDIDGADDVLGYRELDGIFIDGGEDDNYHLQKFSPAIDRGYTWWSSFLDKEGDPRKDDPGVADTGASRYTVEVDSQNRFESDRGVAQGWNSRGADYIFDLPFAFEFYGITYTQMQVSTYGMVGFPTALSAESTQTLDNLFNNPMIAVFWAEVDTAIGADRDIYIDTSVVGEVYVRWESRSISGSELVQFALLLKEDGSIRLDYGQVFAGLNPLVGISYGNDFNHHVIDGYNEADDLTNAASITISTLPGLTDIGAYEFKGSSLDNQAPITIGTQPDEVENGLEYFGFLEAILVQLSESIDSIDVRSPATYELIRDLDDDGLFTDADEFYELTPVYNAESNIVSLLIEGEPLVDGNYQFRIRAGNLRDVSGNRLDGNNTGSAGGDYVREFSVRQPVLPVFTNLGTAVAVINDAFEFQITAEENPNLFDALGLPEGLVIDPNTGLISGIPLLAGEFEITLMASNSDGTSDMVLTLSVLPVPAIQEVIINEGSEQRSMLTRIDLVLDSDISASLEVSDILFRDIVAGDYLDSTLVQVNWSFLNLTITLTFPGLPESSLADGDYQLEIAGGALGALGVALDGDGDGVQGGALQFAFHRFFGDVDGNRSVDTLDGYQFRSSYNSSLGEALYNRAFDYNRDGLVNSTDRVPFEANLRQTLGGNSEPAAAQSGDGQGAPLNVGVPTAPQRYWSSSNLYRSEGRLFSRPLPVSSIFIMDAFESDDTDEDPFWIGFYMSINPNRDILF